MRPLRSMTNRATELQSSTYILLVAMIQQKRLLINHDNDDNNDRFVCSKLYKD